MNEEILNQLEVISNQLENLQYFKNDNESKDFLVGSIEGELANIVDQLQCMRGAVDLEVLNDSLSGIYDQIEEVKDMLTEISNTEIFIYLDGQHFGNSYLKSTFVPKVGDDIKVYFEKGCFSDPMFSENLETNDVEREYYRGEGKVSKIYYDSGWNDMHLCINVEGKMEDFEKHNPFENI